jgi:hypothetical protein
MPLLTILAYIVLWKRIKFSELVILLYSIFCFLLFGITNILVLKKINNLAFYHLFSLAELFIVSHYVLKLILKKSFSLLWFLICGFYFVFWLCNIIFFQPLNTFNTSSAGITNLAVLFICMYYFLNLSKSDEILYFQKLPSFWIVSAFLIYSSLSLLVFISYAYFINTNREQEGSKIWVAIISIATIIKFILIFVGLLCYKRKPSLQRTILS